MMPRRVAAVALELSSAPVPRWPRTSSPLHTGVDGTFGGARHARAGGGVEVLFRQIDPSTESCDEA